MTANNVVDLQDVNLAFGQISVLKDINLQIEAEEFFGIIGPNAAGKSTLLKILLGLIKPDSGAVKVFGDEPEKARSRIGYVPQHPGFRRDFPITVLDVVKLGQLGSTHAAAVLPDKLNAAMEAVMLNELADRQIATLSGGQLQRVLIARALACDPELLILDEPTANIDLRAEEDIFCLLKQYNERMSIIVVSHDIAFISGYVHRVACLNRTLVCHRTEDISGKTIEALYGAPIKMIDHHHH
jgi:zinc transport system ATP-binding protein